MAYYKDGLKHPTAIWEAAAMHHLIRVECRAPGCRNTGTFDAHALWGLFYKRRWNDDFREAQKRFYCRPCSTISGVRVKNARMFDLGSSVGDITHPLPMPQENDWKRFLSRHKG
ncbi:MAG: hypothetical protein EOP83_22885 [Verrucomicrobiaceae bacterium]|nr:MAG: hypothetical protein EOP83_22885 [Verrucomicrobiaceae bacterium]